MNSVIAMKPPTEFEGTVAHIGNEGIVGEWEIMIPQRFRKKDYIIQLKNFADSFTWAPFQTLSIAYKTGNIYSWKNDGKSSWQKWIDTHQKETEEFNGLETFLNLELNWEHSTSGTGIALFMNTARLTFDIFEDKTFITLTIYINLFTDVIYLYDVDNQSRQIVHITYFKNAAEKNRLLLKKSLADFIPKTGGKVVAIDSDILYGVEIDGFNERAILIAES
jgi:hypothetical protein